MRNRQKKTLSLRSRMIIAFAVFTGMVLLVLWLFQTLLLDDVYKAQKMSDVSVSEKNLVSAVSKSVDEEIIRTAASNNAKKHEVCVSVYKIEQKFGVKTAREIADLHINSLCFIHNLSDEGMLNRLYATAAKNGGSIEEHLDLATLFGERERSGESGENVLRARVITTDSGEYFIVLNTELLPLASTVETLNSQLIWISMILVFLAVVLAVIFSSSLSRPIRKMSAEAQKLAMGDYNVHFDGRGFSETQALSDTLNRAAYELSRLDRMQKDLIANVSHDLRTPLTLISGYTEAMRDLPGEATPENFDVVLGECERLTGLVTDMLAVSRYQNGTEALNITRFSLTEAIEKTLDRYSKLIEREGYTIDFIKVGDAVIEADRGRILQVIYNLLANAVNYTGDDRRVVVRQTVDGDSVLIEVIDTGDGIPQEELPLVWERYYKASDFHKRAHMGTGLGLSIVKNILLLHRAEFGVESKVGVGSRFYFKLPIIK